MESNSSPSVRVDFRGVDSATQRRIASYIERAVRDSASAIEASAEDPKQGLPRGGNHHSVAFYPHFSVSTSEAGGTAASALESTVEFIPASMRAIGAAEDEPPPAKRRRESTDSPMRSTSWWRARYHDGSGEIGPLGPFPAAKAGAFSTALHDALGGLEGVALLRRRMERWGCPPVVYGGSATAAARSRGPAGAERTAPLAIYGEDEDAIVDGAAACDLGSPTTVSSASLSTPSAAPAASASSVSKARQPFPLPMCTCDCAVVKTLCARCGPCAAGSSTGRL